MMRWNEKFNFQLEAVILHKNMKLVLNFFFKMKISLENSSHGRSPFNNHVGKILNIKFPVFIKKKFANKSHTIKNNGESFPTHISQKKNFYFANIHSN